MEKIQKRILITAIIGIVLIAGFFVITEAITRYTGYAVSEPQDDFELCLNEQEIILYINSLDPSETLGNLQTKEYLGSYKIINCARDNSECIGGLIQSFPTWIIKDQIIAGDISLEELSEFSKCQLINN